MIEHAPVAQSFTLLCDEPWTEAGDVLGFDAIADSLAQLILASHARTPLSLGIQGSWGSGKSSLMRQIQRRLEASNSEAKTVWFNAWVAERADVLEGLIKSALQQLGTNALRRVLRKKKLMTTIRILVTLVAGWLRVANLVDAIWEKAAVDARARNELRDFVDKAMEDWMSHATVPGSRLIVVFVDDLDRCSPDSVFAVFEAAKLYLDSRGFVFVIGYDESVISEAVLAKKQYSKSVKSRDYLEKIVQIVYRIPDVDDEHVQSLLDAYAHDSGTADLIDESARSLVIEGNRRNPRRLKRFINAFVIAHRLKPPSAELEAKNLVNTLILEMYFPDFTRLFSERGQSGVDPIQEFLDYLRVRQMLTGAERRDDTFIDEFLRAHGVQPDSSLTVSTLDAGGPEASLRPCVSSGSTTTPPTTRS